jgi:hypothetical protein
MGAGLSSRLVKFKRDVRTSFQRPSGHKPFSARIPVGAPQSRLPTGYFLAPIRAQTSLSATETLANRNLTAFHAGFDYSQGIVFFCEIA